MRARSVVALACVVIAGGALFLGAGRRRAAPVTAREEVSESPPPPFVPAPRPLVQGAVHPPPEPVAIEDWLKNGPKEPIIPPAIEVRLEPVDRGQITTEPLVPPVVEVELTPVPGSTVTAEPLTPPEIPADDLEPAPPP